MQEKPLGIHTKLAKIQKAVGYMQKEGRNAAQGYKFLSEKQITEKFKELFEEHGVLFQYSSTIDGSPIFTPSGKQVLTGVTVRYRFIDVETGTMIEGEAAGQGTDSGDKGVYKAITGAIKYIFMKTFLIPTGDDPEDDSETPRGRRTAARRASDGYGTSLGKELPPTERNDVPFGGDDDQDD